MSTPSLPASSTRRIGRLALWTVAINTFVVGLAAALSGPAAEAVRGFVAWCGIG